MHRLQMPPKTLFFYATGLIFLTWLLIMVGGIVHGTESSLACPDWPTCYGSFFPEMKGKIFFEHGHRVVAATVGFLTIVLLLQCWRFGGKRRGLAALALGLVIFQGVLGGMTVIYRLPPAVSTAHLATSMIYFAVLITLAVQLWLAAYFPEQEKMRPYPGLRQWLLPTNVGIFLQLTLGALVRHLQAGLACTEIPFCQGKLWIAGAPGLLQVHLLHRLVGYSLLLWVLISTVKVFGYAPQWRAGKLLASALLGLIAVQIGLGLWSVHSALDLVPITAHLSVGALLWGTSVLLYLLSDYIHLQQGSRNPAFLKTLSYSS